MPTTREDLREWVEKGQAEGATHMIVMCDTFDHDDYPVYVKKDEDVREVEAEYSAKSMQNVMEVYFLDGDIEDQLAMRRSFTYA